MVSSDDASRACFQNVVFLNKDTSENVQEYSPLQRHTFVNKNLKYLAGWGCLRTGYRRQHLNPTGLKWQRAEKSV
jgi:hypothetical protein